MVHIYKYVIIRILLFSGEYKEELNQGDCSIDFIKKLKKTLFYFKFKCPFHICIIYFLEC